MHIDLKKEIKESNPARTGLIIVVGMVTLAIAAPLLAPYNPVAQSTAIFLHPSWQHWLGTNQVGQDIWSQLVYGARTSLLVGFGVGILSTVLSALFGISSALIGGIYDKVVMRMVDALIVIPAVIVVILVAAYMKPGIPLLIFLISLLTWQGGARIVRAQALSLKERGHIDAARASGASTLYIAWRHIVPDLGPILIVDFIYSVRRAVFMEAGLAFLGITDPAVVSWGMMMNDAMRFTYLDVWQWWLLPPGFALSLTIIGLTFIGHAMEPVLEPRLRGNAVAAN
jgi:peptide/nickel transport system permease protein